jgi:hypothetical protein
MSGRSNVRLEHLRDMQLLYQQTPILDRKFVLVRPYGGEVMSPQPFDGERQVTYLFRVPPVAPERGGRRPVGGD